MDDKRTFLGTLLVALSLVAGVFAYHLYDVSKPGNPSFNYDPNYKENQVNLYLSKATGHWNWYVKSIDNGAEVMIDIFVKPLLISSASSLLLEFVGDSSATNVSADSDKVTSKDVTQYSWLNGLPEGDPRTFVLVEFAGAAESSIRLHATLHSPAVSRQNARVTVNTPVLTRPQSCDRDLKTLFQDEVVESPFHHPFLDCHPAQMSGYVTTFQIADMPVDVRIDFERPEPRIRTSFLDWYLENQDNIAASYVIVHEEAIGQQLIFASGIAVGLATALLPLGIEFIVAGLRRRLENQANRGPANLR